MSATLQVSRVPELVSNILDQSDDVTARSCIFVNKLWSDIALDIVWGVVSDPFWIFHVVSPFNKVTTISSQWPHPSILGQPTPELLPTVSMHFKREFAENMVNQQKYLDWEVTPRQQDWERARRYYRRIKIIDFMGRQDIYTGLLFSFSRWCPTTAGLFPNLHTLKCYGAPDELHNFTRFVLGPSIRTLEVRITVDKRNNPDYWCSSAVLSFCELLASRLENLVSLRFDCTDGVHALIESASEGLSAILSTQQKLKFVRVGNNCITPQVFDLLGDFPDLEGLYFLPLLGADMPPNTIGFTQSSSRFPSLREIQLCTDARGYRSFITSGSPACNMTAISIQFGAILLPDHSFDSGLASLLRDIANSCPQLRELYVKWLITQSESEKPMDFLDSFLARPIAKEISHLTISTQLPWIQMTLTDIEKIAASLLSVRVLSLNPGPLHSASSHVLPPLTALNSFARHCQHLETLCLYLGEYEYAYDVLPPLEFRSLSCLNLGKTNVLPGQGEPVAVFLSRLVAPNCLLQSASESGEWQKVQILFPPLAKQRSAHCLETRALKESVSKVENTLEENERLKIENARLRAMDQGTCYGGSETKHDNGG